MAKRPEPDKNAVLCTTCDKQVVKNDKKEWEHANSRVKSHEVIKVIKYSDWAAKYNADRTIKVKGVAVKGPGIKPAKAAPKAAAKPVVKRKTDVEKAAIRAENAAAREKAAAELQARQDAMEEAYLPGRGYHIPLVTSSRPVIRPSTGELYRPDTGEVVDRVDHTDPLVVPPKLGTPERNSLEAGIDHVHEDHPWTPVLGLDGTRAESPRISGDNKSVSRSHLSGMITWANLLKRKHDPNNELEYKVWRAEPVASGDYRGLPYGMKDITRTNRYSWKISSRQRYCEKCAPTITLPTGSVKANPIKSVDRPPMEELPESNVGLGDTTMRDRVGLDRANAGGGTGRTRQRKPLEKWQEAFGIDSDKSV